MTPLLETLRVKASIGFVGAVTGGATGALIGHSSGKTQIAQRVELVDPNQLVRNICKTNNTMETLTTSLPDLLAAQIEELEVLSFNRDTGTMSQGIVAIIARKIFYKK